MVDRLPPFQPDLTPGRIHLLIGHRNAGKTRLIRNLLSATDASDGFSINGMGPSFPRAAIERDEFHPDQLRDFLCNRDPHPNTHGYVTLDDCIYDNHTFVHPAVRTLFQRSRTLNLTVYVTLLYAAGIPPAVRSCIDYVYIYRETIRSNVRRLYDQYLAGVQGAPDLETFRCYLAGLRRCEYDCLVLSQLTGQLHLYRSDLPLPLLLRQPDPHARATLPPPFRPATQLEPGDLCHFVGNGFITPAMCALLNDFPSDRLAPGFLLQRETEFPLATGEYASIADRVGVVSDYSSRGEALANFLLDTSGPTFVVLDGWFHTQDLPYRFLAAHRRERGLLTLVSESCWWWAAPLVRGESAPDYLFFHMPLPESIPDAYRAALLPHRRLMAALNPLRYECLVIDLRDPAAGPWFFSP
jgi:hypothetical protein